MFCLTVVNTASLSLLAGRTVVVCLPVSSVNHVKLKRCLISDSQNVSNKLGIQVTAKLRSYSSFVA